jgi:hypothetical protein
VSRPPFGIGIATEVGGRSPLCHLSTRQSVDGAAANHSADAVHRPGSKATLVKPPWQQADQRLARVLLMTAVFLSCFFLHLRPVTAFADPINYPGKLASRGATHFVAVNGTDAGPGTADIPWATINHAAEVAMAGDTIVVRGGRYVLSSQVRPRNSGRKDAWIVFVGSPGERAVLDAALLPRSSLVKDGLDNGAFQIEHVAYIKVASLVLANAHDAGFTVRDSSNIDLINNSTEGTFSSGIAVWDTLHSGTATEHIRILGNGITRATSWDLAPADMPRNGEPPHEAISIGGAVDFEVAYNHIHDSDKEGIDIKETSKRGKVHHNLVHGIPRQGIYVDAWFGSISDIDVFSNVVHDCGGAGLVLSVENGQSIDAVRIYENLIFDNAGSGLFFSRWGADGPRRHIAIYKNLFYHNGYGPAKVGQTYYWLTGGLYLYSTNVHDLSIANNIFSDNRGFQIGFGELFLANGKSWPAIAAERGIRIDGNLIDGRNAVTSPIESGGNPADRVKIYATNGQRPIFGDPIFRDPANEDFRGRHGSPALVADVARGVYTARVKSRFWWKHDFPPRFGFLIQ